MVLKKTDIDDLVLLSPLVVNDHRGYFTELYNKKNLNKIFGNINFVQDNQSESFKGVLRGLHFQKPPYTQTKLVQCVTGTILDVALDLRKHSKTYGHFVTTILSQENKQQLFIPKGFAHGFVVLSESAIISYKVDNYYNPEYESGIIWNDPDLNIDWKIEKSDIIISEKDSKLSIFSNFISPF